MRSPLPEDEPLLTHPLSASERIAPGATRSWTVETGCHNLQVSNGSEAAYRCDIEVSAGNTV